MNIRKSILILLSLFTCFLKAQTIPKPDHVVILMLENNGWGDIVGNSNAPYINSLINDNTNATFTQSYALTHPSQPNYIMLYSGANQGVTNDNNTANVPWSTPNLGASLFAKGHTFAGYSEDLPSVGSLTYYYAQYGRKHAPWTNWQGSGTNQVPSSANQPLSSFPFGNYSALPTVSFVIPDLTHDMHDPVSNPSQAIANGDAWVQANMASYIAWAKSHNSLLIITFDEDRGQLVNGVSNSSNRITTIFLGEQVLGGSYSQHIDHYSVLRTIEDMYTLPYAGASSNASPINFCWKNTNTTGIGNNTVAALNHIAVFPNPASEHITISIPSTTYNSVNLTVFDITGRLVRDEKIELQPGVTEKKVDAINFSSGVYIFKLAGEGIDFTEKIVVEK